MFNLHDLPTTAVIDGKEYAIDLSFDNVIRIHEVLMGDLDNARKAFLCVQLLFDDKLTQEPNVQMEMFNAVFKRYVATQEPEYIEYDLKGNLMPKTQSEDDEGAEYCIVRDMEYIYPSFLQDYRIDLLREKGKMHWWTFKALLSGLSAETKFKQVLDIRSRDSKDLKGKEIETLRKLKKIYALKPYKEAVQHEGD